MNDIGAVYTSPKKMVLKVTRKYGHKLPLKLEGKDSRTYVIQLSDDIQKKRNEGRELKPNCLGF